VASAGSTKSVLGDGPWVRLVKGRAPHRGSTLYCILVTYIVVIIIPMMDGCTVVICKGILYQFWTTGTSYDDVLE